LIILLAKEWDNFGHECLKIGMLNISINLHCRGTVPDEEYAPQYLLDNEEQFGYLLYPPFDRV
jgi:hypothetical protein